MLDESALDCMSMDILIPESAVPACIIGRFSKERIAKENIPAGKRLYPILGGMGKKPDHGWVPEKDKNTPKEFIPKAILGEERTANPRQEETFGWFLTKNIIHDAVLTITDWSFYIA